MKDKDKEQMIEVLREAAATVGVAATLLEFHGRPSPQLQNSVALFETRERQIEDFIDELLGKEAPASDY